MKFLDRIYDSLAGLSLEHDQYFKYKYSQPIPDDSHKDGYYNYIGEIFDENDNPPNKERYTLLLTNLLTKK